MTHYHLKELATRNGRTITPAVQGYLKKAELRLASQIEYNRETSAEAHKDNWIDGWRWVEHPERKWRKDGLRLVGKVHEIRNANPQDNEEYFDRALVDHNGWYVLYDDYGETCCGMVFRLPTHKGERQYVPGVSDPYGNDGVILDFHAITSDLRDCIRTADRMAELYAEDSRESDRRQRAEDRIEEITGELLESRTKLRGLIRELRESCGALAGFDRVQAALRDQVTGIRRNAYKLWKKRRELQDGL